jgi:hypothetical protein
LSEKGTIEYSTYQNNMFKTARPFRKLLFILLILSANHAFSQDVNTIDIGATYIPKSRYKQAGHQIEHTDKTQKRINGGYSFLISEKTDTGTKKMDRWSGTVSGSYTQMTGRTDDRDIMPNHLFSGQFAVTRYHSLNNGWAMVNRLSAGINSDLEKVDFKDLYIGGAVIFIRSFNPHFSVGVGGVVFNALNTPVILPAIMVKWQTEGKFRFTIDLPAEISTTYETTKKMELKLALSLNGGGYDTENKVDPKSRSLNFLELPLGLENKWKSKRVDFMLGGGYLLLRNFTFKEIGIKNAYKKTPAANKLASNFYINAGIRFRLKQ